MAAEVKEPPDKLSDTYLNCCTKTKCTTVVCIICEASYHQSCFNRLKNAKHVGERLKICPDHKRLHNITSNEEGELSELVKALIAEIKMKSKEEIRKEILTEVANKTQDLMNSSIDYNYADVELLKTENTLQKELIKELQEKNELLKELLIKNKENIPKKSFSEVVNSIKPKPKRVPKIFVKKIDKKSEVNIKQCITKCITNETKIQAKQIHVKENKDIIISCMDIESVKVTENLLKEQLGSVCEIKTEELNNPKIKIVGIDNYTNMDTTTIESDINSRNFDKFATKSKVLHMYKNNSNNFSTVLLEVSPELYKHIRESKNKIFVGYQNCKVYDLINVRPCNSCGRFGHNKNCRNDILCLKCSGKHMSDECKSETLQCNNCIFHNRKYNTNYDIKHKASDATSCEIFKNKIKRYIDSVDYPIKPVLPSWDTTLLRGNYKITQNENENQSQQQQQLHISSTTTAPTITTTSASTTATTAALTTATTSTTATTKQQQLRIRKIK